MSESSGNNTWPSVVRTVGIATGVVVLTALDKISGEFALGSLMALSGAVAISNWKGKKE